MSMESPDFLPDSLSIYLKAEDEASLFAALTKHPRDLLQFFTAACDSYSWIESYPHFIKRVMHWCAKQFFINRLPLALAKRFAEVIQKNNRKLGSFLHFRGALFYCIQAQIGSESRLVNAFMLGVGSPVFKELFKEPFHNFVQKCTVPKLPLNVYKLIETYLYLGEIEDLWVHENAEILELMRNAKRWGIPGLEKDCAEVLKRYIDRDNALTTLLQAQRGHYTAWKHHCYEFLNNQAWGLQFHENGPNDLKVQVLSYHQEVIERFDIIAPEITILGFTGEMTEDLTYLELIARCPKLQGLDLSGTNHPFTQFETLPRSLREFNLSSCGWLKPGDLHKISTLFPGLNKLAVASDVHLDFAAWGQLNNLKALTSLSLEGCHQLGPSDIKLIARSRPNLVELSLEECRNLSDPELIELVHTCTQINTLNLSGCSNLSDRTLTELGIKLTQLKRLICVRCVGFSDEGFEKLFHLRPSLTYVNIRSTPISLGLINRLRETFPYVEIED